MRSVRHRATLSAFKKQAQSRRFLATLLATQLLKFCVTLVLSSLVTIVLLAHLLSVADITFVSTFN